MRAIVVRQFGAPESVAIGDVDRPVLGPEQLLIRVTAAGVNFADVGMVRGANRRREPPFVPGVEAAGVVEQAGAAAAATDLEAGARVVYWDPLPAAFAEYAAVDAWRCVPLPADIPDEVAAALMVQGATAHYLARDASGLAAGQTCLVYSAAGGVGHLLVQIARTIGARVLAVVGSDAKADLVRELGADVVINRTREDIAAAARAATEGAGVDAVYDAVGAATVEQSLRATRDGGTCIVYGGASGAVGDLDPALTARVEYRRTGLATYLADATAYRSRLGDLFAWYRDGQVVPRIGGSWPLERAGEALAAIADGQTTGKLIMKP